MDGVIVVGAGYWGMKYIRILNEMGILKAVVECDDNTIEKLRGAVNNNISKVLDLPTDDYEGVIICTPPSSHVEIAKFYLALDKYVLIEKPIGASYKEVLELYPYRGRIMPGLIYLYNPYIIQMRDYVNDVDVNHIFFRRTSQGPIRPWQDAMWDLAPHDISISNYFMGSDPISARSFYDKDWAMLDLEYIGGVHSLIYVSWLGFPKTRRIEVISNNRGNYQLRNVFDETQRQYEPGKSPLEIMLDKFLSNSWEFGYEEGLSTVKILEELSRSM